MTTRHLYVDESKRRGYVMVASVHVGDHLETVRSVVKTLLLPGQRYLHMKDENDGRKRRIAANLVAAGVEATVYQAGPQHRHDKERRAACLEALVDTHADGQPTRLVIERDMGLVKFDNQQLIEFTRAAQCRDVFSYHHRDKHEELLLGIPDAIAWCWAKGGEWRQLIKPVVIRVVDV